MIIRVCTETPDRGRRSGKDRTWANFALTILAAIALVAAGGTAAAFPMNRAPFLPAQGSTSPANGDLNPYGLALVPHLFPTGGIIHAGQLLVSNFNNSAANGNVQGEGRTIVIIDPDTAQQTGLFFQGAQNIGFTNALTVLRAGFVLGGSVFTESSTSAAEPGGLLVLDRNGNLVTTILAGMGPWGLAANDQGDMAQLFVSDVLGGTITRLEVSLKGGVFAVVSTPVTIGSGYKFGPDKAGLVVGPAGLVYNSKTDTLYVAAEDDNAIFAIDDAGTRTTSADTGTLIYDDQTHLHGPLGLMIAPNGDFVTANADPAAHIDPTQPSELVEFTPRGQFVRQYSIDPNNGSAFAILNVRHAHANSFAYVDDFTSTLSILELSPF
jgi:hypothetical protein